MKPSDVQREVELTMRSLDRIKKATAPLDFAEVLTSKMIFTKDQIKWIKRAKFALAAMVALAIINGALLIKNQIDNENQMLRSVATHYHLTGDH